MSESSNERLRTAVHFTVGKICTEVGSSKQKSFTKPVIASIADLTYEHCLIFAKDLELFAKHAKRTTINDEDVKLLVRRNEKLLNCVQKLSNEMAAAKKKAEKKPVKGGEEASDSDADNFV